MQPDVERPCDGGIAGAQSRAGEDHRLDSSLPPQAAPGDGEARTALTEAEARHVTYEVRQALTTLLWSVHTIRRLIEKARDGQAHLSLGYRSWTEYVSEEFGRDKLGPEDELGPKTKLARDDRQQLVAQLADLGMSTRAIGSFVGAGKSTIADDLRSGVRNRTPEPCIEADETTTNNVVGIDGKSYPPRPEPRKERRPSRSPLPDSYGSAVLRLEKAVESLQRLHNDDRFLGSRVELKERNGRTILNASALLQSIEGDLDGFQCWDCRGRVGVNSEFYTKCEACR